mgnify:CR=1 FL=1
MIVTGIKTNPLKTGALLLEVETDEGIKGLGECYIIDPFVVKTFIDHKLAPIVVGKDPTNVVSLWDDMFYNTTRFGPMGLQTAAIGAIDIALWDIAAKVIGQPVYKLLGGAAKTSIQLYISQGLGRLKEPLQMRSELEKALEQGYRAFKIRMDWDSHRLDQDPKKDMMRFEVCRDFLPEDVPLSFDANNGYSSSLAITQGRILESMGAAHFEEPVPQHDLQGLKECARMLDIPVSFGEQQHTRWQFRDLIELGNPDILQPDIVMAGGITECRRIYDLAGTYGKLVMPHCPSAGVASAASLQLYSTYLTNVRPHEYSIEFSGEASAMFLEPYKISEGHVHLPEKPGLGLELNHKNLEKLSAL